MKKVKRSPASIAVQDLHFSYKSQTALKDVSLHFDKPGVYALVGANGSGKTTLLHLLYALLKPSKGTITLTNAAGLPCTARDISFVPDDDNLIQDLTGLEYLQFVADCFAMPQAEARERIQKLLELFALQPAAGRLIRGYSHGMRKKLQLSAGVLVPADILIIDEPTNGLDPLATALARDVIAKAGVSRIVVVATHDLALAEAVADQVIMIRQTVIAEGTPRDIMRRTGAKDLQHAYVKLSGVDEHSGLLQELFA